MTMILTLRLDEAAQAHFDALRQRHFPPERNLIAAHVTLFHALPESPEVIAEVVAAVHDLRPFPVEVSGVRSLGRGVAYRLAAPPLMRLHARLAQAFSEHLPPQDRQPFQPHVVVQNKVTAEQARALLVVLSAAFARWTVTAEGLDLWQYLGGPWEHAQTFPFAGN